jgi:hypothetical protein
MIKDKIQWRKNRFSVDIFDMLPLVSSDLLETLYGIHEHGCWSYVTGIGHFAGVRGEKPFKVFVSRYNHK